MSYRSARVCCPVTGVVASGGATERVSCGGLPRSEIQDIMPNFELDNVDDDLIDPRFFHYTVIKETVGHLHKQY